MNKRNKESLAKKIAAINSLWDNEERFVDFMPNREMYCTFDFEHEDEPCFIHGVANCPMPDMVILNQVTLDSNTDWLQWELEMME
jgi:hypothetical protein